MNVLNKLGIAGAMMGSLAFAAGSAAGNVFRPSFWTKGFRSAVFVHPTKKGPGRSRGVKRLFNSPGSKMAKQAFNGMCSLRNGCGAAGRLAIEGRVSWVKKLNTHAGSHITRVLQFFWIKGGNLHAC